MARYRHKSEDDMRWNRIRTRITRELDTQIKFWREEALNDLLYAAWEEYTESLNTGKKLEVESDYRDWVGEALKREGILEIARVAPVE